MRFYAKCKMGYKSKCLKYQYINNFRFPFLFNFETTESSSKSKGDDTKHFILAIHKTKSLEEEIHFEIWHYQWWYLTIWHLQNGLRCFRNTTYKGEIVNPVLSAPDILIASFWRRQVLDFLKKKNRTQPSRFHHQFRTFSIYSGHLQSYIHTHVNYQGDL